MRALSGVAVFALVLGTAAAAKEYKGPPWLSPARCARTDPDAVDKSIDGLSNWAAVYQTFQLYRQCDDGYIAEGYSDAVAKLFAKHWATLPEFAKLEGAHPEFGRFAFYHLDETVNLDDDLAIVDNAQNRCPSGLKALCRRLAAAARHPK